MMTLHPWVAALTLTAVSILFGLINDAYGLRPFDGAIQR